MSCSSFINNPFQSKTYVELTSEKSSKQKEKKNCAKVKRSNGVQTVLLRFEFLSNPRSFLSLTLFLTLSLSLSLFLSHTNNKAPLLHLIVTNTETQTSVKDRTDWVLVSYLKTSSLIALILKKNKVRYYFGVVINLKFFDNLKSSTVKEKFQQTM